MKLNFYGFFKQATAGPCTDAEPSRFQLVKRAQWQAWKKHGAWTELQRERVSVLTA